MKTVQIRVPIDADAPPQAEERRVRALAAEAAGLIVDEVATVVLRRRSMDLRRRRRPEWVLKCDVYDVREHPPAELPPLLRPPRIASVRPGLRPLIIGMGPAGLFAALAFADHGIQCTLVDRGPEVERRNFDVRDLRYKGTLKPESNLCFGEGGAGTYSDGKLYTRGKSPRVREVYERLVALGIGRHILVDAHPHVGTNKLIPMAKRLRMALREAGHELLFDARVDDLIIREGASPEVTGVRLADGRELTGSPVILATGHSARGLYAMLARRGVALERKAFAIGARVEHPQALIDSVQLRDLAGHPAVGAAEYFISAKTSTRYGERGVYSFCMCPGGYVLPTPTLGEHLNVNGMSNSGRQSKWANAALVVQIPPEEFFLHRPGDLDDHPDFGAATGGVLTGLALQTALEKAAYQMGGGGYRAPAQRLSDFVAGVDTGRLPESTSYRPGLTAAPLDGLLPKRLVASLRQGARQIDQRRLRGYLSEEATMIAVETTTSSPVRILRGPDRQSVSHVGLFPCAEGAGYAGGIVSSAIDGLLAAEAAMAVQVDAPRT